MSVPHFWELFHAGKATIHRDEIVSMQNKSITLASGSSLDSDFVVFATGWDDDISIFSPKLREELGLPKSNGASQYEEASTIEKKIDDFLPLLKDPPHNLNCYRKQKAWNLYQRIVPVALAESGDNSLVLLGQIHSISTMMLSGVQALWAVEYLRGQLDLPEKGLQEEVDEWNAWTRRRYMSSGSKFPYAIYDFIPYIDKLCRDLGIRANRKGGLYKELFEPYGPRDYKTIVEEAEVGLKFGGH